ncbi:UNVERIFIED_CONTAM: hypothetical protein HDU68_006674 [Siphonaria sp. JEL0065]|nr:hypothetical protein HDU68_006674 [Siphonaria sp. JEL0065]
MTLLFDLVDGLKPSDFENNHKFTSVNLSFTHAKRKEINDIMMKRDKLKKKKLLKISKNSDDPNSQDVFIMIGTPVIANRNYKALKIINSATYAVKKLEPLMLEDTLTKEKLTITTEQFQKYFWVNYCSTCHRVQGESINQPFTIHELSRMASNMRYTAISRTTKKEFINVVDDGIKHPEEVDIDYDKLKRKLKVERQLKDELLRKRVDTVRVINYIVRKGCSDEYCLNHTFLKRQELLDHLGIPDGTVPKDYENDDIRARSDHTTDEDFLNINAYWNLRTLSVLSCEGRGWGAIMGKISYLILTK